MLTKHCENFLFLPQTLEYSRTLLGGNFISVVKSWEERRIFWWTWISCLGLCMVVSIKLDILIIPSLAWSPRDPWPLLWSESRNRYCWEISRNDNTDITGICQYRHTRSISRRPLSSAYVIPSHSQYYTPMQYQEKGLFARLFLYSFILILWLEWLLLSLMPVSSYITFHCVFYHWAFR